MSLRLPADCAFVPPPLARQLTGWLLVAVAFTLPLTIRLNTLLIVLLAVHWALAGGWSRRWAVWRQCWPLWVFVAFYVWHLVGMSYTEDLKNGAKMLEYRGALGALPVLLGAERLSALQVRRVLLAFAAGCLALLALMYGQATQRYADTGDLANFRGDLLADAGAGRVYVGLYLLFLTALAVGALAARTAPRWQRYGAMALLPTVGATLLLLAAKNALLTAALVLTGSALAYGIRRLWWARYALLVLAVGVGVGAYVARETLAARWPTEVWTPGRKANSFSLRLALWRVGTEVWGAHPWVGVGTGDAEQTLIAHYKRYDFDWGYIHRFNTHNQYLQLGVRLGTVGVALWLTHLGLTAWVAWRRRHYLLLTFVLLFAAASLTEVTLSRQKGVVFYALFQSLFFFCDPKGWSGFSAPPKTV